MRTLRPADPIAAFPDRTVVCLSGPICNRREAFLCLQYYCTPSVVMPRYVLYSILRQRCLLSVVDLFPQHFARRRWRTVSRIRDFDLRLLQLPIRPKMV